MEDITDAYYTHEEKFFKSFEKNYLGESHDLIVYSNTLLLLDVFENFRNMFLEIFELLPVFLLHEN